MLVTCFSTAAWLTTSASALPRLDLPSAIAASTSRSRTLSRSSGRSRLRRPSIRATISESSAVPPAAPALPRPDLGIQRVAAAGHARDRVDEGRDVADPLLEQVADAVGPLPDQVD